VKIDGLTIVAPEVTALLFDVDNLNAVKPLVARRGLPNELSFEVEQSLKESDHFSETWMRPTELHEAFNITKLVEGWATVFFMMDALSEVYGEDRVRLIVWFV
jgi:hypothetical protein